MALHWPTFFTRLGSAVVFCIIMLVGLLWNVWSFLVLVLLIQVLCLHEYFKLLKAIYPETYWPNLLPSFIQIAGLALLWTVIPFYKHFDYHLLLFIPALLLLLTMLREKTALQAGALALTGLLYICLPMMLLLSMRLQSFIIPLALVLMLWTNDTMAYLVGSMIGKTPFSKISPKKTWEGTAGGAILTMIAAGVWGFLTPHYRPIDWIALALCASVAGTAGDLLESKLKRMANVKDSGAMMPGHGGALDRFDSLLIATPFAFCYAYAFMYDFIIPLF